MSLLPGRPAPDEWRVFRGLSLFALLTAAVWLAFLARAVLLPFLLGCLLAYVAGPLVTFLELRGLKRSTAVAVLYVAVTALVAALAYWTFSVWWGEIPRLKYQWPLYLGKLKSAASQWDGFLRYEWPWLAGRVSISSGMESLLARVGAASLQESGRYLSFLAGLALNLVLVPFVGFFFLKGGRAGFQALLDACPGRWVEKFLTLLYKADGVIGGYLRGVLTEAFLVGTCAGVGLRLIGVDYAGLLGALAMLFNVVPFLGPMAAGALAVAAAFLQFGDFLMPARVALLFLSLRLLDDFLLQPLVMNRAVHLHPALVIFALLAGHEVAGVWGLLLAVPTVSVVKESVAVLVAWYRSETGRASLTPSLARAAAKPWVV